MPASMSSLCLPCLDTGAALLHQRHSRAAAAPVQANRSKGVRDTFPCVFWKYSQLVPVCWSRSCTSDSFSLTNRARGSGIIAVNFSCLAHVANVRETKITY